jgi:hypothetical protein
MTDVKVTATAVKHVGPKAHLYWLEARAVLRQAQDERLWVGRVESNRFP